MTNLTLWNELGRTDPAHTLTYERLLDLVTYDPQEGLFLRKITQGAARAGRAFGGVGPKGYAYGMIDGRKYAMHRLAFLYMTGWLPSGDVDHINGIKSDNRWCNLRAATRSLNSANTGKRSHNTTGFKGVFLNKRRGKPFFAQIRVEGKQYHLGFFQTAEEASTAYAGAALKHFGEFARSE